MFCEIHFEVSGFEEFFRGFAVMRVDCHADACGGMDLDALDDDGLGQSCGETVEYFLGLMLWGEVFEDDDELVAADAGDGFAGARA